MASAAVVGPLPPSAYAPSRQTAAGKLCFLVCKWLKWSTRTGFAASGAGATLAVATLPVSPGALFLNVKSITPRSSAHARLARSLLADGSSGMASCGRAGL